jgi:lysophospholipid acyltransferase (LPLAT)-like uncharacterized protein
MLKRLDPHKTGYRLLIDLATRLLNLWFSTCRIKIVGTALHHRYVAGKEKVVGATWHRGAIFLIWFFRRARPMVMFSRSRDGELIAQFAENLGIIPVRGSSSQGGREALEAMKAFFAGPGNRKGATVLDGPRGPRCVAKKGMIVLAKEAGVPLLPIMVSAHPAVTLKKTWDRTLIPLPFSRVTVIYREPWKIPKGLPNKELETWRQKVEATLNDMMGEADADTGYRDG